MDAKKSKTADVWRERVVAQQASGQAIRAWCKGNGCHEHAFYWWRSKLGLSPRCGNGGRRRRQPNALRFAEVVIDPRPAAEAIVLRLGGGRELVLPASMPAESVAKLVRSIEGAA
jgi:hypothetical protein